MKKLLLFGALVLGAIWTLSAQKAELKFSIKKGATSVKIITRLNQVGASTNVDFGLNESLAISQSEAGKLLTFNYKFKTVSDKERVMTIGGENIEVLRLASTPAVDGVILLNSPSLKKLNLDYTKLSKSPILDFRKCPLIEEITLNDCDVQEVDLPAQPKLKSFQASPALLSKKAFKRVDLSKCSDLVDVSLNGTSMKKIDLRACPNLKKLVIKGFNSKLYPEEIFGLKAMKKLELVSISQCAVGYDMLPDRNETDIENFRINKMYNVFVPSDKIKGLRVDLSYLRLQKGVSDTKNITSYRWVRYDKDTKKYIDLPTDKIKEKEGVFTFDKSILGSAEELKVRCMLDNAGYNTLEKFAAWKTGYKTYTITLKDDGSTVEDNGSTVAVNSLDKNEISVKVLGDKVLVEGLEGNVPYTLYGLNGQILAKGLSKGTSVELDLSTKSLHILKVGSKTIKIMP